MEVPLFIVALLLLVAAGMLAARRRRSLRLTDIEEPERSQIVSRCYAKIHGVAFTNPDGGHRENIIAARCRAGDLLYLVRELHNSHDKDAIQIRRVEFDGKHARVAEQLGYISRELAVTLAPEIDSGTMFLARIAEITGPLERGHNVGVNIEILEAPSTAVSQSST